MHDLLSLSTHRRGFFGRVSAAAVAFAATGIAAPAAVAQSAVARGRTGAPDDKWLDGLKGKHRQIFDMPQPSGGLPLIHVRNYLNAYRDAYGMSHPDVNAVTSLYFMTTMFAFNDAMWDKYKVGAALNLADPGSKTPVTRNIFYAPAPGASTMAIEGPVPVPLDASMQSLQQRGALFLLCNNAFNFWVGQLARGGMRAPEAIRKELEANVLPGIVIVPAMVVAFNMAQERGVSYKYLA